jgi:hypothetical protein
MELILSEMAEDKKADLLDALGIPVERREYLKREFELIGNKRASYYFSKDEGYVRSLRQLQ